MISAIDSACDRKCKSSCKIAPIIIQEPAAQRSYGKSYNIKQNVGFNVMRKLSCILMFVFYVVPVLRRQLFTDLIIAVESHCD